MSIVNYLRRQPEKMPDWLLNYKKGKRIEFKTIMASRVVYYPGSGFDGQPVATFNEGLYAHVYLYVDYGVEQNYTKEQFIQSGFLGYRCIDIQDFEKKDLVQSPSKPFFNLSKTQMENMKSSTRGKGFGFVGFFERLPSFDDKHGVKRFAVVYLGGDGIATYAALFASKFYPNPHVLILQDHGFGGNYDSFGKNGLMHNIAKEYNVFPELILCAEGTLLWDNYSIIPNLDSVKGGMHFSTRKLYQKNKI